MSASEMALRLIEYSQLEFAWYSKVAHLGLEPDDLSPVLLFLVSIFHRESITSVVEA